MGAGTPVLAAKSPATVLPGPRPLPKRVSGVRVTVDGAFTTLHSFGWSAGEGSEVYGGLLQGVDGNFYGTTNSGGTTYMGDSRRLGTVFKMSDVTGAGSRRSAGIPPLPSTVRRTADDAFGQSSTGESCTALNMSMQ